MKFVNLFLLCFLAGLLEVSPAFRFGGFPRFMPIPFRPPVRIPVGPPIKAPIPPKPPVPAKVPVPVPGKVPVPIKAPVPVPGKVPLPIKRPEKLPVPTRQPVTARVTPKAPEKLPVPTRQPVTARMTPNAPVTAIVTPKAPEKLPVPTRQPVTARVTPKAPVTARVTPKDPVTPRKPADGFKAEATVQITFEVKLGQASAAESMAGIKKVLPAFVALCNSSWNTDECEAEYSGVFQSDEKTFCFKLYQFIQCLSTNCTDIDSLNFNKETLKLFCVEPGPGPELESSTSSVAP
ncbi:uncharacterized protein LOC129923551 [Biomphalaria glabrata]|uniref:Uncharacterized protein LOC129923551 n=1 Tax=Biomphalaria glabrata TaxID=6526 RepID=A0A9W2Z7L4_BIOGL|nr:uncharacterized protein LOC129923551 [Biomphalaria glabrata]